MKADAALLLPPRHHSSSGGSSDTEVKEFAVTPTGVPSGRTAVTTVTPVANRPKASRSSRCVKAALKARTSSCPHPTGWLDIFKPAARTSVDLEEARGAHAAGNAHGHDGIAHAAPPALEERVTDEAGAAHAVGVADGNRAAIDIEALVVDAETVAAVEGLHGERLVQLPQTDVIDLQRVAGEEL